MRYQSLVKNNEFARVYKRGKSYVYPGVVVYILKNRAGKPRVGITCGKKIGKAVARNRARRIIRHALYQTLPLQAGNVDIVIVARARTPYLKSTQLVEPLKDAFAKAGLVPV